MQDTRQATPLPFYKTAVLSSILLCNAIINTILLPFIAFMLHDFGFTDVEIGKYSGYLISSFMLGQLMFSYLWGHLSDRFGRRPILLVALSLTSCACLSFGFSTNYTMAIILRFVTGSVNGIMGVSKTYLAGFALLGLNRAAGLLIGPVIGGMLSNPAQKFPNLFPIDSFFRSYPYALPTMIAFALSLFGTILAYFVLEETLVMTEEEAPLLGEQNSEPGKPLPLLKLLQDKKVYSTVLMYMIISSYYVVYDESFVLWARLPKSMGGIGWESQQIGSAFSFGGLMLLCIQPTYPYIEKWLGPLKVFRLGVLLTIPSFLLLPRISWFLVGEDARKFNSETAWIWVMVFGCAALRSVASLQAYTSIFILIANACPVGSRGTLNGFAQSMGSLSQLVGPVFGGLVFGSSISEGGYGVTLIFNCLVVMAILAFASSLLTPKSIVKRRVD